MFSDDFLTEAKRVTDENAAATRAAAEKAVAEQVYADVDSLKGFAIDPQAAARAHLAAVAAGKSQRDKAARPYASARLAGTNLLYRSDSLSIYHSGLDVIAAAPDDDGVTVTTKIGSLGGYNGRMVPA